MKTTLDQALATVTAGGAQLAHELRLGWTEQDHQTACGLRFTLNTSRAGAGVSLVAIVGGASSGKSTVFNNLLDGRPISQVTIRSHTTRGPIVAVHEALRERVEMWLDHDRILLPTLRPEAASPGDPLEGTPESAFVVYHTTAGLENAILIDTPDFTSEAARLEGDVTLSLLPWFDRLIVLVDHERWFDRQAVGLLHRESSRFGQERFVLFNRTVEGEMAQADRDRLGTQAGRLAASGFNILDYRRGRGFRQFPPQTLDDVLAFTGGPAPDRAGTLRRELSGSAARVLNANAERAARLAALGPALERAVRDATPSRWECMTALMNGPEREQLELVSRVLRLNEMKDWVSRQTERLEAVLARVPGGGLLVRRRTAEPEAAPSDDVSRGQRGLEWFRARCVQQLARLNEMAALSEFWDEVRRWTELDPEPVTSAATDAFDGRVNDAVRDVDEALERWSAKVQSECQGVSPHVVGAVGTTAIGVLVLLVAVPGPLSVLTVPLAAGAVGGALGKLAAAAGVGVVAGKHLGRLAEVMREKLLGCPELDAVQAAAERYRGLIEEHGRQATEQLVADARRLVLRGDDPLLTALDVLHDAGDASP